MTGLLEDFTEPATWPGPVALFSARAVIGYNSRPFGPEGRSFRARRFMVTRAGPLATISCEPRQARKGAAAAVDSCAGVWLVRVATHFGRHLTSRPSNSGRPLWYCAVLSLQF